MKDSIILGTGNSRYLKSVENFKSLYPTYDDFVAAMVSGTLPVDFNGINPAGFQQVGNPLGKAALLKDATAALYGLPNTAVPDDALRLLAPAVSHWWRRRSYQMIEERTALPNDGPKYIAYGSNADDCVRDVQYASEVMMSYGGGVELIGPQTVRITWTGADAAEVLKGMYVLGTYSHPDDVLYFEPDEVFLVNSSSSAYWVRSKNTASYLVSAKAEYGAWEYVHSSDEDAYPHSGAADGYEYEYLGQPYPPKAGGGGAGTGAVSSVNGKTGEVELTAGDVGAATVNDVNQLKSDIENKQDKSNYELIEEIILTEDVESIIRTQEPSGLPYNFDKLIIKIWGETSGKVQFLLFWGSGGDYSATESVDFSAYTHSGDYGGIIFRAWREQNPDFAVVSMQKCVRGRPLYYGQFEKVGRAFCGQFGEAYSGIPFVRVELNGTIPTGTHIEIYGVRA